MAQRELTRDELSHIDALADAIEHPSCSIAAAAAPLQALVTLLERDVGVIFGVAKGTRIPETLASVVVTPGSEQPVGESECVRAAGVSASASPLSLALRALVLLVGLGRTRRSHGHLMHRKVSDRLVDVVRTAVGETAPSQAAALGHLVQLSRAILVNDDAERWASSLRASGIVEAAAARICAETTLSASMMLLPTAATAGATTTTTTAAVAAAATGRNTLEGTRECCADAAPNAAGDSAAASLTALSLVARLLSDLIAVGGSSSSKDGGGGGGGGGGDTAAPLGAQAASAAEVPPASPLARTDGCVAPASPTPAAAAAFAFATLQLHHVPSASLGTQLGSLRDEALADAALLLLACAAKPGRAREVVAAELGAYRIAPSIASMAVESVARSFGEGGGGGGGATASGGVSQLNAAVVLLFGVLLPPPESATSSGGVGGSSDPVRALAALFASIGDAAEAIRHDHLHPHRVVAALDAVLGAATAAAALGCDGGQLAAVAVRCAMTPAVMRALLIALSNLDEHVLSRACRVLALGMGMGGDGHAAAAAAAATTTTRSSSTNSACEALMCLFITGDGVDLLSDILSDYSPEVLAAAGDLLLLLAATPLGWRHLQLAAIPSRVVRIVSELAQQAAGAAAGDGIEGREVPYAGCSGDGGAAHHAYLSMLRLLEAFPSFSGFLVDRVSLTRCAQFWATLGAHATRHQDQLHPLSLLLSPALGLMTRLLEGGGLGDDDGEVSRSVMRCVVAPCAGEELEKGGGSGAGHRSVLRWPGGVSFAAEVLGSFLQSLSVCNVAAHQFATVAGRCTAALTLLERLLRVGGAAVAIHIAQHDALISALRFLGSALNSPAIATLPSLAIAGLQLLVGLAHIACGAEDLACVATAVSPILLDAAHACAVNLADLPGFMGRCGGASLANQLLRAELQLADAALALRISGAAGAASAAATALLRTPRVQHGLAVEGDLYTSAARLLRVAAAAAVAAAQPRDSASEGAHDASPTAPLEGLEWTKTLLFAILECEGVDDGASDAACATATAQECFAALMVAPALSVSALAALGRRALAVATRPRPRGQQPKLSCGGSDGGDDDNDNVLFWSPLSAPVDHDDAHDVLTAVVPLLNGVLHQSPECRAVAAGSAASLQDFLLDLIAATGAVDLALRVVAIYALWNMMGHSFGGADRITAQRLAAPDSTFLPLCVATLDETASFFTESCTHPSAPSPPQTEEQLEQQQQRRQAGVEAREAVYMTIERVHLLVQQPPTVSRLAAHLPTRLLQFMCVDAATISKACALLLCILQDEETLHSMCAAAEVSGLLRGALDAVLRACEVATAPTGGGGGNNAVAYTAMQARKYLGELDLLEKAA